jgi:hypothetical protein
MSDESHARAFQSQMRSRTLGKRRKCSQHSALRVPHLSTVEPQRISGARAPSLTLGWSVDRHPGKMCDDGIGLRLRSDRDGNWCSHS